jgi:hypothetical protein
MRRNWTAGLAVGLAGAAMLVGSGTAHAQARGGTGGVSSGGLGGGSLGGSSLGGGLGGTSGGLGGGSLGGSSLGGGLGGGGLGGSSPFGGSSGVGFMGGGGGTFGIGGGTTAGGGGRGGSGFGGTQGYGTTGPMGPYMGNPLSLGVPATTNTSSTRTRTFGTVLYNVSSQTGLGSGTGGFGGTAGVSTGRAMGASSIGVRRAPAYVTVLGDTVPPVRADMLRVRADLQDVVARSSRLPSRGNIRVLTDGSTVVLRGNVTNDHERRLAEALVRLTPGVRAVRNELATPEATAGTQP